MLKSAFKLGVGSEKEAELFVKIFAMELKIAIKSRTYTHTNI